VNNPLRIRRMSLGLILTGAVLAGSADGVREAAGTGEANWTFFLDVMGLLLVLGGSALEARSADLLFTFAPAQTRRRALILLITGLVAFLFACVLLSKLDQPIFRGAAGALLMGGIGIGAGGLFSLVWIYGGNYAAERIQDRANDDWR
jgi:hypothetical protein